MFFGGNRMGMYTILTKPLGKKDIFITRVKRPLEKVIINMYLKKVNKESALSDELLSFIENCSWDEVKEHMCGLVKNWEFTDWETMFVAKADGMIIGMASAMKEDYYPLPEIFPWVSCVFVSEEYRGLRISGKLIDFANEYLKEQGFTRSYIPTPVENVGLYERYGYSFVKDIANYDDGWDLLYSKEIK